MRILALAAASCLLMAPAFADPASNPHNVAEPAGLYQGAPHGYTPPTLKGAKVLGSVAELETLIKAEHPVLIDVSEQDRKPPSMSKTMIWLPQHRSIPGADWMPGAGNGTGEAAFASAFRTRMATLTNGKPAAPVVTFCHPDCWASWNAAKRLVGLGYTNVYWFPAGIEGWQDAHDTAVVKADAGWLASLPKDLTQ